MNASRPFQHAPARLHQRALLRHGVSGKEKAPVGPRLSSGWWQDCGHRKDPANPHDVFLRDNATVRTHALRIVSDADAHVCA